MSLLTLDIQVGGDARAMLARLEEGMIDLREIHEDVATRAENVTRDYLTSLAQSRHATADRLGATPTGHLERAAESVTSRSDATAAVIGVTSPGITRAFHDVTITPINAKYLAVAATSEAYGKRPGAFNDLRLAFFKGGKLALVKADQSRVSDRQASGFGIERAAGQKPPIFYWLVKSVHQAQDRSLLPSDELLKSAAEEGVMDWLQNFLN